MPRILLDPKDRQVQPVGLRAPDKGKRWEHVNALGEFLPIVGDKVETGATTRSEKERGIISISVKDGVRKDITLAEERIIETRIDMEVKDESGTVGQDGVGAVGGQGGTRSPVDAGGQLAGRPERVDPR